MSNAIEVINLSKTYSERFGRKTTALDQVSFNVEEGEAFGFVGPNGAGKSTTIKIITGVAEPSSGRALLFGESVETAQSRRGVAYVPESPYLYDYLTPMEILQMSLHLHGKRVANEQQHCMRWLERFSLAGVATKSVRQFSKGMTQRTILASALVVEPRLLILDEPLSGLDPVGRREVVEIMSDYHRAGGTLFFSSHVLYDVERLAGRFGLINKGQLRTVRRSDEILDASRSEVHITYAGLALEGATPLSHGKYQVRCSREDSWQVLDRIRADGGVLQEVVGAESLESVFFKLIDA